MPHSYIDGFRQLVPRFLHRPWADDDGISEVDLDTLLADHDFAVPQAMHDFYRALGRCDELMEAHNYFWDPDELEIEDDYLLFLDEEHEVVNWGIRHDSLDQVDPIVWQRVNIDPPTWKNEEAHFSLFVEDMFDWVFNDEQ